MKKLFAFIGLAGFLFAGDNCAMCHNGGMAKKLDTLTPAQIEAKMKEYKAGKGNPMMVNVAKGLKEADIKRVAKEFGKK
ncbi:cytochrome c553 [Lebetimonas sp. JH292]|uniref:c-type cytochrome n=1 Tax=Lebetimonas sp. JH292 TaxID=990068 RepID=UPI000466EB3E|nr:cytochrome c553 [Lebetimonas sp. JH292]